MALLDFPSGPGAGDTYTLNGNTWKWNGTSWTAFNSLSLSSQVTGILAVQYGGTGFGGTYNIGDILYASSSNTFAKLSAGTAGSVLASGGSGAAPYWKIDDTGAGTVGSGNSGGFAYYTSATNITSGTAFSYINGSGAGGTGANVVLTQSSLALVGSTITSGEWKGSAIGLTYGGTNANLTAAAGGIVYSTSTAMAITSAGTTDQILKSNGTSAPSWVNQSSIIAGGATTAAQWQTARTVTFSGGGVTGSFSINGSADVTAVALNVNDDAIALGTKTTGNYASSVAGAGNGLSTIGSAGEGTAFTIHSNATNNNTASTLVFRDASGNFSAGTITASLSGTATSANAWTSFRTVTFSGGGVTGSFSINGSADVTSVSLNVNDDAIALGTKTTGNYAASVAGAGNGLSTIGTAGEGTAFTIHSNATNNNTASTLVFRDGSGNFSAGTITASLSGLASTASNLLGGNSGTGQSLHVQTGVNTTSFLNTPGTAGLALTTRDSSGNLAFGSLSNLAVTSLSSGPGILLNGSIGSVTVSNVGVTSISGASNQISATGSTGSITLSLPNTVIVNNIQVDGASSTLTNVGTSGTSMVNKQYVDNLASGLDVHASVRVVLASAIGGSYYHPNYGIGSTGIGAYITSIGNSDLTARTFDGITLSANQRVLITAGLTATGKTSFNGSALVTPSNSNIVNGIYTVGSVGSGSSQWYLYRATDTDDNVELTGGTFVFVEEGTSYADSGWVCSNDTTNLGPIQFGSTAITFTQFSGAAAFSSGQGLTKVGSTFATKVNLSSSFAASAIGFTQFNIGGAGDAGVADTGYYPTFSVRTGSIHAGTSLLTLNHTGFSLTGSTNTAATLTVTGNISLPNPGTAYGIAYASDTNTVAFSQAGSSGQILKSNATSAPTWIDQSTIIAGGATTAAQWQTSRTVTFSGGGVTGSFSINGSANVTAVALNIDDNAIALGTKTTGNYALSVAGAGNGLSTIGTAGEGTAFTIHSNATNTNTASTLVFRDASGNFTAGTITASLSGTATSANAWTSFRTVTFSGGGVTGSFNINGSADVTAVALNIDDNAIALGTKTTGNYALSVAGAGNGLSTIGTAGEGTAFTIHSNATNTNTASTLVFRDGSGNFSAGTITANLTGTASIASSSVASAIISDTSNTLYILGTRTNGSSNGSTTIYVDNNISLSGNTITANLTGTASIASSSVASAITADTSNTLYILGTRTNGSSGGSTTIYVDNNISLSGNTITANLTGTASIASSAAAVNTVTDITNTLYLLGSRSSTGIASTQTYVDSNISISGVQVTAGVWAGTAISLANGGTNNTAAGNGFSSKMAVYNVTGTAITALTHTQGHVIFGATGGTYASIASTVMPVVAIGSSAPAQPGGAIGGTQPGQLWWDSEFGVLKVYYTDATPTSQWVDATPVLGSSGGGSASKRSYVMSFGAGFTPSTGADTVQILVPYAPDNSSKYYYIKRLDYRNETAGTGSSFYIERYTGGVGTFNITSSGNRIHSAAGTSFVVGSGIYITSYTLASSGASFVSSTGVAGSIISGDYLRLNFTHINNAATMSISVVIEEQ